MAVDLKDFNVAALSIWMGPLLAERLKMTIASDPAKFGYLESMTETPEFTGHIIWALYNDPEIMALWGLLAEGEGRDDDADHAYRAALALRHEEDYAGPDPYEALARLEARRAAAGQNR